MSLPKDHTAETKRLLKKVSKEKIARWLLEEGYYPEQYIVPPTFKIIQFNLRENPFFAIDNTIPGQPKFEPEKEELINISFPKTELTDRTFGIIAPKIYHDIVWYIINDWETILKSLFRANNNSFI